MEHSKENTRKIIIDIFLKNPLISYAALGREAKVSRATARNVVLKFQQDHTVVQKKGAGRKSGSGNKCNERKVLSSLKAHPCLSVRDLSRKHGIPKSTVQNIKSKLNLRTFKVQIGPRRDEQQDKRARTRARKLHDKMLNGFKGCILMDDETYVKADFQQLRGQRFYSAFSRGAVKKQFMYQGLSKFAKKHLIWQAICTCGKSSKPYVAKGSVNSEIYQKECLQKRLLPLYKDHDIPPIFWPDLATCHYSIAVQNWYQANGVRVVPKAYNPPNCPHLRPVEKYWAIVKRNLIRDAGLAKSPKSMLMKWKKAMKKVGDEGVKRLMAGVKNKVRKFAKAPRDN